MQLSYFKKTITIILRKLRKKNYFKLLFLRLIALLNTLNKILELIILKRLCYVVKTHNTLLNIQIKVKRQRLIDTTLQLITKKIYTIRLIVGLGYDIIPLVRPDVKIGSRRFFGIESLKLV